ncbi:MAG: UvrD-helicase domain-containing protein [Acidimicrobiia bacterium]|nr:UvrD-helicase domain-containing protein [Acidimicrobiia bacterium]
MVPLNPAQYDAVLHEGGPLLVSAGAGSGKTRVLTRRIAHLIADRDVSPFAILAITFTNKAAEEMRSRVVELVGPVARRMWVRTFHSACAQILRREAERLGYSIYDQADSVRLTRYVMVDLGLDTRRSTPQGVHGRISAAKSDLLSPGSYLDAGMGPDPIRRQTAEVYAEYQRRLQRAGAMDFDDLLTLVARLFREHPDVLATYQERFQHVLVDEYQDTNRAQNEIVLMLGARHRNVFVVGDADQSIYRFRGATMRNILDFESAFEDTTVILLEQNYRSTQNVLDAANAVIANNADRHPKRLWSEAERGGRIVWYRAGDEDDEARWVVREIRRLAADGHALSDFAVMYRINAQSRALETALNAEDLPYVVIGGTAFYDRREVRDALAYLRAVVNPADEVSLKRVLNVPRRGIGDRSVERLDEWAASAGLPFSEALRRPGEAGVSGAALAGIQRFTTLLDEAAGWLAEGPKPVLDFLLTRSGYLEELYEDASEGSIEAEGRLENLAELLALAEDDTEVGDFLEQTALVSPTDDLDPDGSQVVLLTAHAAKGLEFPVVFLTGLEEGMFPREQARDDPEQMAEERRLAYVGITRARERLYLSDAERRTMWGAAQYNRPSRFLEEIPSEVLQEVSGRPDRASRRDRLDRPAADSGSRRAAWREARVDEALRGAATERAASPAGPGPAELPVGSDVRHPAWGVGVVVDAAGSGEDAEVTVRFGEVGEKRLLVAWAPLERIAP